jgi:hypothetical protein
VSKMVIAYLLDGRAENLASLVVIKVSTQNRGFSKMAHLLPVSAVRDVTAPIYCLLEHRRRVSF